jgi:hypothetical protein
MTFLYIKDENVVKCWIVFIPDVIIIQHGNVGLQDIYLVKKQDQYESTISIL